MCEENEAYDHTKQDLTDTHHFEKEAEKTLERNEKAHKKDLKFGPIREKKKTKPYTIKMAHGKTVV